MAATAIGMVVALTQSAQADPVGQTLLSDSFTGATTSSPIVALSQHPGFPCLTAGTSASATPLPACQTAPLDSVGSGVLRLTDANVREASGIIYNSSFPLVKGLVATFDTYQWGGSGADGISFDLAVAPPAPARLGDQGGGLGYAPDPTIGGSQGLPGGYLGIGLDAFGTYSHTTPNGCPALAAPAGAPNWITVRGPGYQTTGYCRLSSAGASVRSSTRAAAKRALKITIDPTTDTYTVAMDASGGTNYTTVTSGSLPTSYYDPTTGASVSGLPTRLTFAVAGSTGASTDYHEIDNLNVTTLTGAVPVLGLTDTDDSGAAVQPGGSFHYTLTPSVTNAGGSEDLPTSMQVTDALPAGVSVTAVPSGDGWDCSASTTANVSCTYTTAGSIPAGTTLPPITVPAQVAADATVGATLTDAASVISDDAATPAAASDPITVAAIAPTVVADPADQFVTSSQDATFSAAATGDPAPSAQWQSSSDGGATWTDIGGATGDTLTVSNATVARDDGTQYRVVYTNSGGTATSHPATLHVGPGTSTTAAMTLTGAAYVGVQRSYVATVTPSPAAIAVSGTVTFTDDGAAIPSCAAVPVTGSQAECDVTWTAAGTQHIQATYNGSTELLASTSDVVSDTIAPVATATQLGANPGGAVVGQPVTFTATVSEQGPGSAPLDGAVTFAANGAPLPGCTGVVLDAAGTATCTAAFPHVGAQHVTATYGGGPATAASLGAVDVGVAQGATATTLRSSANPAALGSPVTFTATVAPVAPASGPVSDGSVTFRDGSTVLGSSPVTGSADGTYAAALTTSSLSGGAHTITAQFSGNADLLGSSATLTENVTRAASKLVAKPYVSVNPLTLRLTPSATLTTAAGVPLPGRTVTFTAAGATICSGTTNSNGVATCTGSLLRSLVHVALSLGYTASFAGDADYLPASDRGHLVEL